MKRELALKILLVLVGLALLAGTYPLVGSLLDGTATDISVGDQMILGIYLPIGVFLLLAVRDPSANRSLIICFAWSTLAHDAVMILQAIQRGTLQGDLPGLLILGIVSAALLVLAPRRRVEAELTPA